VERGSGVDEPFLPLRHNAEQVPLTTHFRSTWLASSLRSLRDHGLFERYEALLAPQDRDTILGSVAGTWLPVAVATAHYEACARLELPTQTVVVLGQEVQHRVNATVLGTVVRLSKNAGVTPWVLFSHFQRLWDRIWMGGDIAVVKRGPKDARIDMVGCTLCPSAYYRAGFKGVLCGLAEMFCTKVYVHEERGMHVSPTRASYRVSWA